jgi:uncharacterized protein
MNQFERMAATSQNAAQSRGYDEGLRQYFQKIYNYMAGALAITGLVAYFASSSEAFMSMVLVQTAEGLRPSLMAYVLMFAPLGVVFYLSARLHKLSYSAAQSWFWAFSVLMGLSLYYVFAVFTGESIVRVFFITAATFGATSLWGYTTKKDLSGWGSFLMMGVIGLIIASVVNIFMKSPMLYFAVSFIGVGIFIALTAYDTQRLKSMYYQTSGNAEAMAKSTIMGALSLYINFINIFVMLLQLLGDRR